MGRCDVSGTYTATTVDIDGAFGPLPALVEDGRRWNGFAYAWFPVSSMDRIVAACAEAVAPSGEASWVVLRDGVYFEGDEEGAYHALMVRVIDGVPHYGFGGGWCWLEVSGDDEDGAA